MTPDSELTLAGGAACSNCDAPVYDYCVNNLKATCDLDKNYDCFPCFLWTVTQRCDGHVRTPIPYRSCLAAPHIFAAVRDVPQGGVLACSVADRDRSQPAPHVDWLGRSYQMPQQPSFHMLVNKARMLG